MMVLLGLGLTIISSVLTHVLVTDVFTLQSNVNLSDHLPLSFIWSSEPLSYTSSFGKSLYVDWTKTGP